MEEVLMKMRVKKVISMANKMFQLNIKTFQNLVKRKNISDFYVKINCC